MPWVQPLIITLDLRLVRSSRSYGLWKDTGKTATFEGTVVILTEVCFRPEASRPEIYIIVIVILPRPVYSPVVGRDLRSAGVHTLGNQQLAQTRVVLVGSGGVVEARLGPVVVSHWNSV